LHDKSVAAGDSAVQNLNGKAAAAAAVAAAAAAAGCWTN